MDVSDNERYLRYLLLLGEGGLLVLRGIVLTEVSRRKQTLHAILSNSRALLTGKINDQQYRHIYPTSSSVTADISAWDINLLGTVITHVFGNTLDNAVVKDVKKIQDRRTDVSDNEACVSLEKMKYCQKRLKLSLHLLNLAALTDFNTHYLCLEIVSATGAAPYSIHTLLQKLADLQEFRSEMMENLYTQLDNQEDDFTGHIKSNRYGGEITDLHMESWYFGPLSRDETNEIFERVHTDGLYLVRDSQSDPGNYVLCVKEGGRVSQYFIHRVLVDGNIRFHIGEGDKTFDDLSQIVDFYSTHYLNKTPLTEPAPRQTVFTKSDFTGDNPKDLPFKKGEVLEIISKEEERWWYAKNADGTIGIVPVLYLTNTQEKDEMSKQPEKMRNESNQKRETIREASPPPSVPKRLPSKAIVIKARISNPYDKTQLTLHEGDIVNVTKMFANGQWHGECRGKTGTFPYKHVTFLDDM